MKSQTCMVRKNIKLFVLLLGIWPVLSFAQSAQRPSIVFLNKGKMNVAVPNNSAQTNLYIKGSMMAADSCSILQNGTTEITGDVYHHATTHLFDTDSNGFGKGIGTFKFSGNNRGYLRYIMSVEDNASFDKTNKYITFPNLEINTNDEIQLASRMGIDATKIIRSQNKSGALHLKSETMTANHKSYVYDTSLRILGNETSDNLAVPATVVMERDVSIYIDSVGSGVNTPLFGFATPFNETQIAGYFAGNWIRQVSTGINQHVSYPLADSTSTDGSIALNQFITDASQKFVPGNGYFIRLRDKSANYNNSISSGALPIVDGQDLNVTKTRYVFDGNVYDYSSLSEQVFSNSQISRSISVSNNDTINWIIGNSYTAPISIPKLATAMTESGINFDGKIYLFPLGSTTFQPYNYQTTGLNSPDINAIQSIPATSVFMLKVKPGNTNGTFSLTKDLLTHGTTPYNLIPRSVSKLARTVGNVYDQVSFTVSLATNANIYDKTTMTVYDLSSWNYDEYDAQKEAFDVFGLYSLSNDGIPLSMNIIPDEKSPIDLSFKVRTTTTAFHLEATNLNLVNGEGLWIKDKQNSILTQLEEGEYYEFTASPTDAPDRFTVYFHHPETSSIENGNLLTDIKAYCRNGVLNISNLDDSDLGAKLAVYDMQGRRLQYDVIHQTPNQSIDVSALTPGVYIVKIEGARTFTSKFIR